MTRVIFSILFAGIFLAIGPALLHAQGNAPKYPDDVVFSIGKPDMNPGEFTFLPDWAALAAKVPDKTQPVPFLKFIVGKSKDADWSPWHWSTAEAKAGFRKFTAEIEFDSKTDRGKMFLVFALCHGISGLGSEVHVETNGVLSQVKRAPNPGMRKSPWVSFSEPGDSRLFPVEIPAGVIRKGKNTIKITLDKGSFFFYDYLALREKPEALPLPPVPSMLDDFLAAGMPEEILFVLRKPSFDGHWYANIGYYGDNACRLPFPMNTGGAICIFNVKTKQVRTIFADWEGNIRDPQIHYDAEKLIFAYLPKGKKHYSLYEINVDGTNLRQITGAGEDTPLDLPAGLRPSVETEHRTTVHTRGEERDFAPPGWDDYEPTYLPDDSIIFCSTRAKRWVNCWLTQVGTIHKCDANGQNIRELSPNVEQDNTPWVLPNGQIIYMRWEYVDREQVTYHHLWTMNPDGTRQ
ncbi:MAG: hypothetical protein E7028_10860, partial [Planctomycetaceae bacterium]|nr:hypothetical protein [Planctomycetaceae bacterium]